MNNETYHTINHRMRNNIQTISMLSELYCVNNNDHSFSRGIHIALSRFQLISHLLDFYTGNESAQVKPILSVFISSITQKYSIENFKVTVDSNISSDFNSSLQLIIILNEILENIIEKNSNIEMLELSGEYEKDDLIIYKLCFFKNSLSYNVDDIFLKIVESFLHQIDGTINILKEGEKSIFKLSIRTKS
jgi:hypothetical protein